jgi:aryl sulfotransferase
MTDSGTDDLSLDSLPYHYRSFARWTHLPNIHFFHYAALKQDIHAEIRRYAAAIGLSPSEALVSEIAASTSFASMRNVAGNTLAPRQKNGAGIGFVDPAKFFDSATSNKWEGRLSDSQFRAYRDRFADCASPEEIAWLETGSSVG